MATRRLRRSVGGLLLKNPDGTLQKQCCCCDRGGILPCDVEGCCQLTSGVCCCYDCDSVFTFTMGTFTATGNPTGWEVIAGWIADNLSGATIPVGSIFSGGACPILYWYTSLVVVVDGTYAYGYQARLYTLTPGAGVADCKSTFWGMNFFMWRAPRGSYEVGDCVETFELLGVFQPQGFTAKNGDCCGGTEIGLDLVDEDDFSDVTSMPTMVVNQCTDDEVCECDEYASSYVADFDCTSQVVTQVTSGGFPQCRWIFNPTCDPPCPCVRYQIDIDWFNPISPNRCGFLATITIETILVDPEDPESCLPPTSTFDTFFIEGDSPVGEYTYNGGDGACLTLTVS